VGDKSVGTIGADAHSVGLAWVAVILGLFFMIVHSLYLIVVKPPKRFAERTAEASTARIPERVPRHSLAARLFHWIMAASMFTLLFTAFLPRWESNSTGCCTLDRWMRADDFDSLSHCSCIVLSGFLVDMAG